MYLKIHVFIQIQSSGVVPQVLHYGSASHTRGQGFPASATAAGHVWVGSTHQAGSHLRELPPAGSASAKAPRTTRRMAWGTCCRQKAKPSRTSIPSSPKTPRHMPQPNLKISPALYCALPEPNRQHGLEVAQVHGQFISRTAWEPQLHLSNGSLRQINF